MGAGRATQPPARIQAARQPENRTKPTILFAGEMRKVMTYNVENLYRAKDGETVKDPYDVEDVARAILQEHPPADVIALQEAGDDEFLKEFNEQHLQGLYPHVVSSQVRVGNGIQRVAFLSRENIKPIQVQSHWRGDPDTEEGRKELGKRDILEATFETETGYQFTILNVHFRSMRTGVRDTHRIRLQEAEAVADILNERFQENPNAHIMVVGDLNTNFRSPYGQEILDILALVDQKDRELIETMLKDKQAANTSYQRKLDYIFVSKSLQPQVRQAYVSGNLRAYPYWSSDHLPMVTVFEEPDEPTGGNEPQFGHRLNRVV